MKSGCYSYERTTSARTDWDDWNTAINIIHVKRLELATTKATEIHTDVDWQEKAGRHAQLSFLYLGLGNFVVGKKFYEVFRCHRKTRVDSLG